MALTVGSRLGHDIAALIGEGGMGQVYRATDTQLGRDVALKILPDAFAADPDRPARFQREAQVLASLNHPNIAAIYGYRGSRGTRALVLELVEGPTLADRIAKDPNLSGLDCYTLVHFESGTDEKALGVALQTPERWTATDESRWACKPICIRREERDDAQA